MDDSPSGTFPTASISATHPQEWTVLAASLYFVISNAPGALSSGFAKRRTPICQWAPNLTHVSQLTDDSDPISGFHNLRFPDDKVLCQLKTPVANIPMGRSISAMCPNCWMARIKSRDFAWCKVKNTHLCESGVRISELDDRATHASFLIRTGQISSHYFGT
jgi:hypothetical protein